VSNVNTCATEHDNPDTKGQSKPGIFPGKDDQGQNNPNETAPELVSESVRDMLERVTETLGRSNERARERVLEEPHGLRLDDGETPLTEVAHDRCLKKQNDEVVKVPRDVSDEE